ncbi:hypothetical protein MHYP_G00015700 [Metynnis hypsauchen]
MDAEPEPGANGKRKVRGAKGARRSTKKRERKAVEESGTLPPPSKHLQALDAALQSSSFLPPIRGSSPPPRTMKDNWMEKVGLDLDDEPTLPSAVQRETSPEVTFSLPSEALDILFSARLLGNETPEPEHGQMSSGDEKTLLVDPKDSKVLTFFQRTAEELIKLLVSTFDVGTHKLSLYEHLVDRLMEEVEILARIKFTFEAPDGQLFPDDHDAISHIIGSVLEDLLTKRWIVKASWVDQRVISYIANSVLTGFADYTIACCKAAITAPITYTLEERSQGESEVQEVCSTVLSTRSPSEELIHEVGGSPDLSDECSEIFKAFQTCRYSLMKKPIRLLMNGAESPLETGPDLSIPAVKALDEERSQGESEVQEVCSTILSTRSPSEELIREFGGSPDLSDDECSEIFKAFQTCRYSLMKKPIRLLMHGAESPLETGPDSSSSIPAVKVTEATCLQGDSEDSDVEQYEGLEVPACPDGTTDSTPTRAKKWKKLRTRISSFLRRVFCFGCLPSQRVVPL